MRKLLQPLASACPQAAQCPSWWLSCVFACRTPRHAPPASPRISCVCTELCAHIPSAQHLKPTLHKEDPPGASPSRLPQVPRQGQVSRQTAGKGTGQSKVFTGGRVPSTAETQEQHSTRCNPERHPQSQRGTQCVQDARRQAVWKYFH